MFIQVQKQYKNRFQKKTLCALVAMAVAGVPLQSLAQEQEEELIVTAQFKRNLQNALDAKRDASKIVDGISADDIGSLPALDLGEALQAVPGVQLNREGERRESSINLRGLPSGFVLTTANGQSIANPTRSSKVFGAPNPFGVYDAAVFNGIEVIKTPTADMHEGGIAGVVNQKLVRALSAPEQSLRVQASGRYEELADEIDPEGVISGSKHLNDGQFAVAGTLAWSKQNFRRDTIKINRYDNMSSRFDADTAGQSFDEWRAANGVPDSATVEMPGELRQSTETNDGERLSFSGGFEWQPTEQLTLGANVIFTERDMDNNGFEQIDMRPRQGGSLVTPLSAPRNTGTVTESGNEIWSVSDIAIRDVQIAFGSREWDLYEQSQAFVFDGVWQNDDWKIDGAITLSEAESSWDEVLLAMRYRPASGSNVNPLTATLSTGRGDIDNFSATLTNSNPDFWDLDSIVWNAPQTTMASSSSINSSSSDAFPSQRQFGITGTWEEIERDNQAFEFNVERFFDGPITSIKAGYRYSNEDANSDRIRNSTIGVDMNQSGFGNSTIRDPSYTRGDSFFGGEADGYLSAEDGWISWNPGPLIDDLIATIPTDLSTINPDTTNGETAMLTPRGFIQRGRQQASGLIYDTSLDTHAAYLMMNFKSDLGSVPVSGNAGVRYVQSDLEAGAPSYDLTDVTNPQRLSSDHDYSYVLPSLNVAFDFHEDLRLRMAYNEGIVRPNLRFASPASTYRVTGDVGGGNQTVEVNLPSSKVDPFDSKSYDLSLEWYNREGSAVTFALFKKDINNYFEEQSTCDNAILAESGFSDFVGNLSVVDDSCVTSGVAGIIDAGTEVDVLQIRNVDEDISVDGYEISVQQNLDFLPGFWSGFGGILNYSHTSQSGSDDIIIPGISEDTYNVIAYYEQSSFGIRLAYNYRSDYQLESVGTFNGAGDKSVQAAGRFDMSAYYKLSGSTTISFKGYNLTETLYEEYESVEWQPRATHFDGRTFVLAVKHKLF